MRCACLLALGAVACNRLFGITEIGPSADAATDTSGAMVTGTLFERYTTNDAMGLATVVHVAPVGVTATAVLDDGTQPTVDYHDDGTFAFGVAQPGQRYRIRFQAADFDYTWEHTSATLKLAASIAGRPFAQRKSPRLTTPVQFSFNGIADGTMVSIGSTGLWTSQFGAASGGNYSVDWKTQPSLYGPLGLLDASKGDRLVFATYAQTASYVTMSNYVNVAQTLTDGQPVLVGSPLQPATPTSCVHVATQYGPRATALANQIPGAAMTGYFGVGDIASPEEWIFGIQSLAYGSQGLPGPDSDLDVYYFDPYGGTVSASSLVAGVDKVMLPGATSPLATASLIRYDALVTSTGCATVAMPDTFALAGSPVLAGTPLATGGSHVALPRGDVPVTWSASGAPVDQWTVALSEIELDSTGNPTTYFQRVVVSADTTVHFDAADFVSGHGYIIAIGSATSIPGASGGDFTTLEFPVTTSDYVAPWFIAN